MTTCGSTEADGDDNCVSTLEDHGAARLMGTQSDHRLLSALAIIDSDVGWAHVER